MGTAIDRKLRWAVEAHHRCKAMPVEKVIVHEKEGGQTIWYGTVTVFELDGHPTARRAYAWYYELAGGGEPQFFSALHAGPIASPAEALRAAFAAMNK